MLFVNFIMDTFASLVLASELPEMSDGHKNWDGQQDRQTPLKVAEETP
jgi:hypothetical protein